MKRAHDSLREPSQRQLRVGEAIRHVLADVLARGDLQDPALFDVSVTISEVRPAPDLRHATVYCAPLGGGNAENVIAALNRAHGPLQKQLGRSLSLKFTPKLSFKLDTSFERAAHLDRILKSDVVARDLAEDDSDTDENE